MDRIAQQQLQHRESAIAEIHSVADAERRKQSVRERLLDILGGLPDYNGPLNSRVTARIEADSYTIENVIFESLPRFYYMSPPTFTGLTNLAVIPEFFCSPATHKKGSRRGKGLPPIWL